MSDQPHNSIPGNHAIEPRFLRSSGKKLTEWSTSEIPNFVENFWKTGYQLEHYRNMAKHAEKLLRDELSKIKTMQLWTTTHRAKTRSSLKDKLIIRHQDEPYTQDDDLREDIVDLAGVRVILYLPSEHEHNAVQGAIQNVWGEQIERVDHPTPKGAPPKRRQKKQRPENNPISSEEVDSMKRDMDRPESSNAKRISQYQQAIPNNEVEKAPRKKYQRLHLGYRAIHYRCKMTKAHEEENWESVQYGYEHQEGDQVEIQVVSALTHAWAQASHTLLYKYNVYGKPTLEEERIFDALNGLILSGDLLIEQFHSMLDRRTYRSFDHRFQLEEYLENADVLQELEDKPVFDSEGVGVLLGFLQKIKRDCPYDVREALKQLGFPDGIQPRKSTAQFKPSFDCVEDMETTLCLIADNMPDYELSSEELPSGKQCYIMMSALTLLQAVFKNAGEAHIYLQKLAMEPEEKESLEFVLRSEKRQIFLDGKRDQERDKPALRAAWVWFQKQTQNRESLCGLVFRVAQMGAIKEIKHEKLLDGLAIGRFGSLSSSDSVRMDEGEF